jgi:hypothetical protein
MYKARSSQLLTLLTDIEETHEALSAVQETTSLKEQFLLVNDSENIYCKVFLQNRLTVS